IKDEKLELNMGESVRLLQCIGSINKKKIVFLCAENNEYTIVVWNLEDGKGLYKKLNFGQKILLASCLDDSILFFDYEDHMKKISFYKLSFKDGLKNDPFLVKEFVIPSGMKPVPKIFVSGDGTKMAFTDIKDTFFIQSLNDFTKELVSIEGLIDYESAIFTPDGSTFMIGCNDGKILAFD